jgi:DNA mismatch repair protein MutS2
MDGFLARGAFFIVTTHQSSLKSYALARNEISNASMQFDVDKMEPTYKFLSGVPGNSYAFALAKRIGLPPGVMSRAQDYLGDKHSELEKSIEVIQQYRHEVETLRNEVVEQKRKAETKREEYERKFADFKARYNDLVRAAKAEAADIVSQANALVENTIREIREQNKPVAEVKKAFDAARSEIRSQASSKQATQDQAPEISFADGDVVTMEGHSTPGVVVSVEQGGKSAVVEFDSVKFRVSLASLKHSNAKPKPRRVDTEVRLTAGTQIDVRGQYADQAILEVEQAIAEALMGSVYELTIIHGKGTGALRTAIQRELARHPGVTSFRDGSITEGGSGVTVAVLKS